MAKAGGGSIGGGGGGLGRGGGVAVGAGGGIGRGGGSIGGGIETGRCSTGPAPVSGLLRMDRGGSSFGAGPAVVKSDLAVAGLGRFGVEVKAPFASIVKEGPVSRTDLRAATALGIGGFGGVKAPEFNFGSAWKQVDIYSVASDRQGSLVEFKNTAVLQRGQVPPVAEIRLNNLINFRGLKSRDVLPKFSSFQENLFSHCSSKHGSLKAFFSGTPLSQNGVFLLIKGNTEIESLSAPAAIAEAEAIISQARKNSILKPNPLKAAQVITEANHWLEMAQITKSGSVSKPKVEPGGARKVTYQFADVVRPRIVKPEEVGVPQSEPKIAPLPAPAGRRLSRPGVIYFPVVEQQRKQKPASGTQVENKTRTGSLIDIRVAQKPVTRPLPKKQEVEQVVKEKVKVQVPKDNLETERIVQRKRIVVDYEALATVLVEADQAFDKAEAEAVEAGLGKKVLGERLAKLVPGQHPGNTGGAVKPNGFDGTIPARREALAAVREFKSKKEVRTVMLETRPITFEEEGESAREKEIVTTFRNRIIKPVNVIEIVIERTVKREKAAPGLETVSVPTFAEQEIHPKGESQLKTEPTLKDLNLEGIFQKAA